MPLISPRRPRLGLAVALGLASLAMLLAGPALASAQTRPGTKTVRFHGYRLVVPTSWPVYRLSGRPTTCVRFDRHAVYLGQPSADQRCPAVAAGRTEAILVQALRDGRAATAATAGTAGTAGQTLPMASPATATHGAATAARVVNHRHGVVVTATWNHDPAVIRRALGLRSLTAAARQSATRSGSQVAAARALMHADSTAHTAVAPATAGEVYTGAGFDACNTPSSSQMAAWGSSPYRAVGVYIGGANMACSQPNLTSTWVSQQSADGWHLVPIYVGLQAPSNSCGCASISPATASTEGVDAAEDAVGDAQAIGLGAGNPLYLDMESYTRNSTNSAAVLAFIEGWTDQLHAEGYASGVYSSDDSGILDLVDEYGTGYVEPDDIWIADWNDSQTTADANVPSTEWADNQRLHQYEGAHNATYSGVTINIDGDYLDGSTAAAGTGPGVDVAPTPAPAPALGVTPVANGETDLKPSWLYATGVAAWQLLGGKSPTSLTPLGSPISVSTKLPVVSSTAMAYYAVTALGADGQALGTSAPVATPKHLALFGQNVFVPRAALGAVPVGCYSTSACTGVRVTITSGKKTLLRTGSERIPAGGGLDYFELTAAEHRQLWEAKHHEETVTIAAKGAGGLSVSRKLTLTSFTTLDPSPPRSLSPSSAVHLIGTSDFVSNGWVGGILAECVSASPCVATTKIVADGKTIAQTKAAQTLGQGEVGYLMFTVTAAGHRLLQETLDNQLPATVTVKANGVTASGHLALTSFY